MRYVYIAETFGDDTGSYRLGIFGTRARARRAVREAGYTVLREQRHHYEYWVRAENRGEEWPSDTGTVKREAVE